MCFSTLVRYEIQAAKPAMGKSQWHTLKRVHYDLPCLKNILFEYCADIFENFNFFNPSWWRQHYKRGNWWVQKSLGSKITNINTKTYSPTKTTDPSLNFMELVWNYMKCKKKCTSLPKRAGVVFKIEGGQYWFWFDFCLCLFISV